MPSTADAASDSEEASRDLVCAEATAARAESAAAWGEDYAFSLASEIALRSWARSGGSR